MTNQTFLPRDPEKALVEVKERLYDRLDKLRSQLPPEAFEVGWEADDRETQIVEEILFLENLLNDIEMS